MSTPRRNARERWRFAGRDKRGLLVWVHVWTGYQHTFSCPPRLFWNKRRQVAEGVING